MTHKILGDEALDVLFREARTHNGWDGRDVTDVLVQAVYDLMKWGPTSANCCPARFVFVKSKEAKERLAPHMDKGNLEKTMAAPVTAIIGYDLKFYEALAKMYPHGGDKMAAMYEKNPDKAQEAAFRNGSLQGAYFLIAARALGLDCGPMSGFNADGIQKEFFAGTSYKPNFLCNLGYGDPSKLYPRGPRFGFDDVCKIL